MARQTQCRACNNRLLSAGRVVALAKFTEPAHIKRDLMGKFDRGFTPGLYKLNVIATNGCSRVASHFCAPFGTENHVPSRFLWP